jgi:hypothetical protein
MLVADSFEVTFSRRVVVQLIATKKIMLETSEFEYHMLLDQKNILRDILIE